jgi:NADH dehydrogenase
MERDVNGNSAARTAAPDRRPQVVILGGGFGGLYAARALKRAPVRVTLVDRQNHHLFQPLLYQVATAALGPSDIAMAIRRIFRRQANVDVIMAEAVAVDPPAKQVTLSDGALSYDYLIVATGVVPSYFGHDGWPHYAPGLKTVDDALETRRRILLAFEAAERATDPESRRDWLTFVVVGGGSTGVELVGALAELARDILERDFRALEPGEARVLLVEAGPRILPNFPPGLSARAERKLNRLGVEVKTGQPVTAVDGGGIYLGERRLNAKTVLWAAGVKAPPLARSLGAPLDRAGRALVRSDLTVPGAPEVFVIGDLAALEQDGEPVPGLAPAAIQEGRHAAANILRAIRGEPYVPFRYRDCGTLATVGRATAVAELGPLRVSGWTAWLLWLFVHILWLIGFRNRFLVMFGWAWTYLRFERGARLITGDGGDLMGARQGEGAGEPPKKA